MASKKVLRVGDRVKQGDVTGTILQDSFGEYEVRWDDDRSVSTESFSSLRKLGSGTARGPGGRFAKKSSSRTVRRGTMGPRLPGGGFYSTGKKNYCSKCGGPHKFKHGRA